MLSASFRTGTTMETATSLSERGKLTARARRVDHSRRRMASVSRAYRVRTSLATPGNPLARNNFAIFLNAKAELPCGEPGPHPERTEQTDDGAAHDVAGMMGQQHEPASADRE